MQQLKYIHRSNLIRILIVDDHTLFRRCLAEFLGNHDNIKIVGEASSPGFAASMMEEKKPDLVLVDLDLGGEDGFELAEWILKQYPHIATVILTASENEVNMQRALEMGASGYLSKEIDPDDLVVRLQSIIKGEKAFSSYFLYKQAIGNLQRAGQSHELVANPITNREQQVLQQVTSGLMDKQIAIELCISVSTVKNHLKNIRKKLGAANRVQACLIGVHLGLVKERNLERCNGSV